MLRAATHGDRPAVVAGGRAHTYRELDLLAEATARRLAAVGVGRGDRVATTLPPGAAFAALLHAVPRIGAILVPVNTRLSADERRAQLEAAAPFLVVEEPLEGSEAEVEARATVPADEPWTLLFTSGTTGAPKPVLLTHGNHAASAFASAWGTGVAPDDHWLCVLPLFHVGGLAILIRSAVYGTAAVVHERFKEERAAAALESGEVTLASLVPTMLQRLVTAGVRPSPRLRGILLGGAGAPTRLLDWAAGRGLRLIRTYGMTETASQVAVATGRDPAVALPGVRIRVAPDGQILVAGPMVAAGVAGPGGLLRTGDRGAIDEDGRLEVHGRIDEVIVTGGEKVAAPEVEEALARHPAVADAAVVGLPDREWGEVVTACVVASGGVEAAELRAHCHERLAPFKVPKRWHLVDSLPRTAAGKIRRGELRSDLSGG
ncbi:MAG TPA: AMP-binding protein [Thermoleophilaceae bacterium]|nr:AMP-binding protein [Thermoleophilaceae bacterium]